MDRATIVDTLRAHADELRALGVQRISLFGSYARGMARDESDIDLLGRFDESKRLSLLDVVRIENYLTDLFGRKVDLVDEGSLDPRIRPAVEETLVDAF